MKKHLEVRPREPVVVFSNHSCERFLIQFRLKNSCGTNGKVEVFDNAGLVVHSSTIRSDISEIDMSKVESGDYFIFIKSDNLFFYQKIVKR
jgi:hypothetical protein